MDTFDFPLMVKLGLQHRGHTFIKIVVLVDTGPKLFVGSIKKQGTLVEDPVFQ